MRPAWVQGSPDNLYHNNGDGTFSDVSKKAGVDDPEHRYGLTAIWSDFDNDGKLDLFVTNDGPTTSTRAMAKEVSKMLRLPPEWQQMRTDMNRQIWACSG